MTERRRGAGPNRAGESLPKPWRGFHAAGVKPRRQGKDRQGKEARENRHVRASTEIAVQSRDEEALMRIVAAETTPFILIVDCVQDPHNLGAILRTADGAGIHAVVAPKDKQVRITETVRRVSVGGADHVPFVQVTNLARTMEKLKDAGVWIVGTSDRADKSLYDLDLKGPLALVMGAEEKGMRRLTEENCDFLASIPMAGHVDCLNVSVSAGVCLFEAVRQRRAASSEA
ncbi:23S rRNA (guanosine(2251)-2'-O)-methyltransferase RlmB [Haloferula rosea]|uniref:23S rRNA (Guanosine(2251)-2'-O)-methyltransferase RlmB n=1 Tax=Haloferula rosea TaxID=490093 RepID=A0A934RAY7_9BACT|nr:23S rRNA (guanosine(2251)-2'-O)-methyltransferase RlmB [Haloferula rosea]